MERRRATRIHWESDCVAYYSNESARGQVINVSATGMALLTPHALPVGSFVRVQWLAPGNNLIDSDAIVVRVAPSDSGRLAGLRVQHLDARVTEQLLAMLRSSPPPRTVPPAARLTPPVAPNARTTQPRPSTTPPVAPNARTTQPRPGTTPPVAPRRTQPPPRRRPSAPPVVSNRELAEIYRAALAEQNRRGKP